MADPVTLFAVTAAAGAVATGVQQNQQAKAQAARLDAEARLASTQALQRDTQARDELRRSLSAIQSARSANGLGIYSPNARLLEQETSRVSRREREITVADYRQRSANLTSEAAGTRRAGRMSLLTSAVKAAVPIAQSRI